MTETELSKKLRKVVKVFRIGVDITIHGSSGLHDWVDRWVFRMPGLGDSDLFKSPAEARTAADKWCSKTAARILRSS